MADKVNYILDADIKGFFDNLDHEWMIKFLEHDIADKNFIRYIKRFLIGELWRMVSDWIQKLEQYRAG